MSKLEIEEISENAISPMTSSVDNMMDIFSPECYVIEAGKTKTIRTGIRVTPKSKKSEVQIRSRALAARNCGVEIVGGVITVSYSESKEIIITLINHGEKPYRIKKGSKIAEMFIYKSVPEFLMGKVIGDNKREIKFYEIKDKIISVLMCPFDNIALLLENIANITSVLKDEDYRKHRFKIICIMIFWTMVLLFINFCIIFLISAIIYGSMICFGVIK